MKVSHLSIVILLFFSSNIFGQAGIKIFTKLEDAKFQIKLNGELENTIPISEISYDSLDYRKVHNVIVSFSGDSIADIDQDIQLLENQFRVFEILKKKSIRQKTSMIGRKIGKVFKFGKHDKDDVLYDIFYLEDRTKSKYVNE